MRPGWILSKSGNSLISRLKQSLASRGLLRTALHLSKRAYRRLFPRRLPPHPFDLQHCTDTGQLIPQRRLASGHKHDRHITAYVGTAPSVFRAALARWQDTLATTPHVLSDYAFIDIGCGKGRVVLLASESAFCSVLGVELNPQLASIAQQNLAKWLQTPHTCKHCEVRHADALAIDLPAEPVLLFLYNPFDAVILKQLLDRLQTASPTRTTPIDILYAHPDHASLIAAVPGVQSLWEADLPLTPEDRAADPYLSPAVRCHLYRLIPPANHSAAQ